MRCHKVNTVIVQLADACKQIVDCSLVRADVAKQLEITVEIPPVPVKRNRDHRGVAADNLRDAKGKYVKLFTDLQQHLVPNEIMTNQEIVQALLCVGEETKDCITCAISI